MSNKGFINRAKSGLKAVPAKLRRIKHRPARGQQLEPDTQLAAHNVLGRVGRGQTVQQSAAPLAVEVDAYAGSRAEQTPRRFTMGLHTVEIATVTHQWETPAHSYYRVRAADDRTYVIRYDATEDRWELTERSP